MLLLFTSCKTSGNLSKTTTNPLPAQDVFKSDVPEYNWFQAKGKISFTNNDENQEATLVLVVRHDSLLWGSVNAIMGVEIFRFYITRDSMYIIDRPAKKYYCFSLQETMLKYAWKDAGFELFEKLLFGYSIFKTDEHYLLYKDEISGEPYLHNQDMLLEKKIYTEDKNTAIKGYIITRMDNSQRLNIRYTGKIKTDDFSMPAIVDLKYHTPSEFSLNLTFTSIRFIKHLNLNTAIPAGYEKGN
jgi:hypothetical protein